MTKSHKVANTNKVPTPPVDSREALQWFVNNFGLYVGSVRGLFLSDWGDEQAVSLEASVVSLRSRGFSPLVVTGESIYKQADYVWQEAREKATFGRPIASKFELEVAANEILVVDNLEPPMKPHHLWYLLAYVMHPRAIGGKAQIFTTSLSYQDFLRAGHNCPETDFIGRPINWEKFIWMVEATTINQDLFKLAREESVPPMLKAEYYAYMALRDRNIEAIPQHVLGDYLLDFALVDGDRKLNIECDTISALSGHEQQKRDAQRDLVLMADGWQILRFSTAEILNNRSACADVVEDVWRVGKKRAHCGRVLTGRNVPARPELPADDEDQRAAISYGGGPAIVIGGSGNGKTTCLVQRVGALLAEGISPESILIVTHNAETFKPLKAALDGIADKPHVQRLGLFSWHDLGLKILKENMPLIKRKPPLKIDANNQKVIQRVYTKVRKDFDPVKLELSGEVDEFYVAATIAMYKAHLINPKRAMEDAQSDSDRLIAKIYEGYEDQLLKSNRIDRDDVIAQAAQLLLDAADIRARYQNLFEYVLVDEYQEVTLAQDVLIRILAAPQDNLYVTGDEQEATSEHRNGCPELLNELSIRLPHARCFVLERNWRCHPEIVDYASHLASHLERTTIHREYYSGWGAAGGGAIIGPQPCHSQKDEAEWIGDEVQAIISAGRAAGEIAVLFHHASYEELIKQALISRSIKFLAPQSDASVVPDEVGDMLAYLKLVLDPDGPRAREAFERVSQLGFKEIDPKLSATIASFAEANNLSYLKAVEIYAEATADQSCRELEQCVKIIRTMHMDRLPPGESIGFLRRNRRLNDYYKGVKLPAGVVYEPLKKLQQLEEEARKFSSVGEFVKHMEGRQKEDESAAPNDSVHIKAVLDCKGWEFAFVFLPGLVEGFLPSEKSSDVEEERRIFYVALTRARERVYLSYPVEAGGKELYPSRFIGEARLLPLALTASPQQEQLEEQPDYDTAYEEQVQFEPGTAVPEPAEYAYQQVQDGYDVYGQPVHAIGQESGDYATAGIDPQTGAAYAVETELDPGVEQAIHEPVEHQMHESEPPAVHYDNYYQEYQEQPVLPANEGSAVELQHADSVTHNVYGVPHDIAEMIEPLHEATLESLPEVANVSGWGVPADVAALTGSGAPAKPEQAAPVEDFLTSQVSPPITPVTRPRPGRAPAAAASDAVPVDAVPSSLSESVASHEATSQPVSPHEAARASGSGSVQGDTVDATSAQNSRFYEDQTTSGRRQAASDAVAAGGGGGYGGEAGQWSTAQQAQVEPDPVAELEPPTTTPVFFPDYSSGSFAPPPSEIVPDDPPTPIRATTSIAPPAEVASAAVTSDTVSGADADQYPLDNTAYSYSEETEPEPEVYPQDTQSQAVYHETEQYEEQEEEDGSTLPRCPQCSEFLEGNSRFCGECGYSLPERIPVCSSCSMPLEPSAKFCGECGEPIQTVSGPPAGGQPQQGQPGWMGQMMKYLED